MFYFVLFFVLFFLVFEKKANFLAKKRFDRTIAVGSHLIRLFVRLFVCFFFCFCFQPFLVTTMK